MIKSNARGRGFVSTREAAARLGVALSTVQAWVETGILPAWKTAGGELAWSNERLLYRGLSAPLSAGRTVAFGDLEGQVHLLDRTDGKTLLRLPTDGSPVVAQPVLSGTTMLVVTRNGGLFAFRPE